MHDTPTKTLSAIFIPWEKQEYSQLWTPKVIAALVEKWIHFPALFMVALQIYFQKWTSTLNLKLIRPLLCIHYNFLWLLETFTRYVMDSYRRE